MTTNIDGVQKLHAQTAEEVLNDEAYHLYVHLISTLTSYQLGKGKPPTEHDLAMWCAVQTKRIETSIGPLDTFLYRRDRRPHD
ncbi:MAG: hypothetical protein V4718_00830 [Pseudomonadota bacterium]